MATRSYDAIVVGSGITGGWAAKELGEKGLQTLVLEAGRPIGAERSYHAQVGREARLATRLSGALLPAAARTLTA